VPHTTIISTATLAAQLADPDWLAVDCRYDLRNESWGREQYAAGHIPGAVYASLSHDLAATPGGSGGRHPLPEPRVIADRLAALGISGRTQVVAYDQDIGMWASRLWWMLRYIGHDAVAVLDGGFAKWTGEGRPTKAGEDTRPAGTLAPRVRGAMRRQVADIEARLHDRATLLIDARAPERFEGQSEPVDRVPGHMPGAVNAFYKENVTAAGTLKTPDELRQRFSRVLGGHSPDQAVMYCGSGVSACHNLLAMEQAGMTGASLYVGSWSEWSADPARPVETGKAHGTRLKAQEPGPNR
jgi:thiosulfate/3-mercaptopyruvate sulfurtransferase